MKRSSIFGLVADILTEERLNDIITWLLDNKPEIDKDEDTLMLMVDEDCNIYALVLIKGKEIIETPFKLTENEQKDLENKIYDINEIK